MRGWGAPFRHPPAAASAEAPLPPQGNRAADCVSMVSQANPASVQDSRNRIASARPGRTIACGRLSSSQSRGNRRRIGHAATRSASQVYLRRTSGFWRRGRESVLRKVLEDTGDHRDAKESAVRQFHVYCRSPFNVSQRAKCRHQSRLDQLRGLRLLKAVEDFYGDALPRGKRQNPSESGSELVRSLHQLEAVTERAL